MKDIVHMKSPTSESQKSNPLHINLYRFILFTIGMLMLNSLNAQDIRKHKWENRVLLIHSTNITLQEKQIAELEQSKEDLEERKVVIYQFLDDQYKVINYQGGNKSELLPISKKKYKNVLKKDEEFKLILIGLDGGKKLHKTEPITVSELIDKIDSMPMRKAEIRNNE